MYQELNVDSLVGPTHHFAGVGVGNVASIAHRNQPSHPKLAALACLQKAWKVACMGVPQFVLPPPQRPCTDWLRSLGFRGDVGQQLAEAQIAAPQAYAASLSSAFMWTANAGTFSPACDTEDRRAYLVLANLNSSWHRGQEAGERSRIFRELFHDLPHFCVHEPLPSVMPLRDEGAANHMRLSGPNGMDGVHLFVYGEDGDSSSAQRQTSRPARFPARQTLAASQAVARQLRIRPDDRIFLQQNPIAIDEGVFHNDVIATSHRHLLIYHQRAFLEGERWIEVARQRFEKLHGVAPMFIEVKDCELSLPDAVGTYLFNSQIVDSSDTTQMLAYDDHSTVEADREIGTGWTLFCAQQCHDHPAARALIDAWIKDPDNPIQKVVYVSLDESMQGGGGPACLRLRLQVEESDVHRISRKYRLDRRLYDALRSAIETYYPNELDGENMRSEKMVVHCMNAWQEVQRCFDCV